MFWQIAIITLATSAISLTITKSAMFGWFRDRLTGILSALFHCHYCLSHWIAFVLVAIYQPNPINFWAPLDLFLIAMAIVGVASMVSSMIIIGMRKA